MGNGTEVDLKASEELSRRLIDAIPAGFVHVRIDGNIERANSRALDVLGLSYDELTRRYTQDFAPETVWQDGSPCPPGDYPVTIALTTGKTPEPKTIGVRRPDGTISWGLYTAVPVHDPETGATTGAVVTILDMTERLDAEQARRDLEARLLVAERMAAVGTLAAGVAHEVNNPLTYVLANIEEVREGLDDGELADRLDEALEGARRIEQVVGELSAFARGGSAETSASVGTVLDAAIRLTRNDMRHRARLRADYSDSLVVRGGSSKLGQLFLNLLINAMHAIPTGHAEANEVVVRAKPLGIDQARITVSDTGVGVPASMMDSLFEPFVTTRSGSGSGLGLYICQTIVDGLGGTIGVQSVEGKGTTFTVDLPLADAPPWARSSDSVRIPEARPGRSVLIVDDEPGVRRVMLRLFKDWDVAEAAGGREALAQLDRSSFDVIVCDLMMPEVTGIELYHSVLARQPDLAARFMFVTGAAFTAEAIEFVRTVPCPVIRKPFKGSELLSAARDVAGIPSEGN